MTSLRNKTVFLLLLSAFLVVATVGCHSSSAGGTKNPFSAFQGSKKEAVPKKVDNEFKTMNDFVGAPRPKI